MKITILVRMNEQDVSREIDWPDEVPLPQRDDWVFLTEFAPAVLVVQTRAFDPSKTGFGAVALGCLVAQTPEGAFIAGWKPQRPRP